MKLAGRTILITGAAGGIGAAIARRCAAEGAMLWLADIVDCTALAGETGGTPLLLDVSKEADWAATATRIATLHGLVNNAAISGFADIETLTPAQWRRFQSVNADSIYLGTRAMLPALRRAAAPAGASAAILNIGSTLGLRPKSQLPAYAAAKAALIALTKSTALHCAERGHRIRVNALHPGSTETPMMAANLANDPQARARRIAAHPLATAMNRLIQPEDVAAAALFLLSDDSAMITGIDLPVDAGATI
ncbi:SDR family oxidoreductase [Sandaracinobacteroides saxicola]|uniref:SDR family oxidoreductase n=1 Tax=Sandaracinobacteroides saxicola TaxID=2759707 RepID=A0A7G5IEH2_9SPHN|nr:SDR family oxidoreductase [Sandaracinobacteroides saxicola]QMW21764.1 SDR family oxidoreductase [Sandaracinobacteroides saxicola]